MHYISSITIKNFKSVREETFQLTNYTPLVGYNNAGKSNILEAIKWLLNKSSLAENCFNNIEEPIEINGYIEGITEEILNQLPTAQRNSIQPYIVDNRLGIKRTQEIPSVSVRLINIDVLDTNTGEWVSNPNGLDTALKNLFPEPIEIGAMENAAEDIGKSKNTTTIGKLIAEIMSPIEENHSAIITEALDELKKKFDAEGEERAEELIDFDTSASIKVQDFFPGISIKLHVPTPIIKDVFKNGTIKVYENDIGRDLTSYGHGTQRSVQMSLVRHLADIKRGNANRITNTLLLIDEPELYLHPQAIEQTRLALKILANSGYQVIFTTHSPQMIPSEDVKNTLLIRKYDSETKVRKRLLSAVEEIEQNATSQFELLFSLENANQILFSEHVLLAEGKTEKRLLPYIFNKYHSKTLGEHKIAFTELGGSGNTLKSIQVLNVMDLPAKAIVDLDFAFKECVGRVLNEDDVDVLACKNKLRENNSISLSEDGLPKKNSNMSAADAYHWLSQETDTQANINNLHIKLKAVNIWLWKNGVIEEHLNLTGKSEQAWAMFKRRLDNENFENVITDNEVVKMLDWLIVE